MAKLYIVATPIGNLQDISLHALEVFKSVDFIICEDTRVTKKLLDHYNIKKPLISYHQHSSKLAVNKVIKLLSEGKDLAQVTDAGTPGIQDPGGKLVSELVASKRTQIVPIPGASAVTALLSVSGLPTDSFLFLGFLPKKKRRQKLLQEIIESDRTVIFYESGQRVLKTLEDLILLLNHPELDSGSTSKKGKILKRVHGDAVQRQIVIGRELTKKFETIYRGTIEQVIELIKKSSIKGEFVVAIKGKK